MYYFASGKVVDVIVIRTKVPTPENVARLLAGLLKIRAEPRGLVIVSEEKIRILQ